MIFRSPHALQDIPEIPLTDFVLQKAREFGDKPALVDGPSGRAYSYDQLPVLVKQLAAGLANHGFGKGDVLAIFSVNLPEYVLAFHAVATLGGITTMVPPLFTGDEIRTQLRDSETTYLLTIPQLMSKACGAIGSNIRQVFVIGEAEGATPFASLISDDKQPPAVEISPRDDIVALPFSSGTTGFPKGVMLSHYNLVSMLCQLRANDPVKPDDSMVCVVPMYHLYGLHVVANLALTQGATVVTMQRYDLKEFLGVLERFGITVAPVVPPIVLALSRDPAVADYDLSRLRAIHCGAASLAVETARACTKRLGCEIRYGYGLTEVSPLSHATVPSLPNHDGSVGYCLPNTECRIVDYETGAELGANEEGEIWLRGPQVMKGYLANPQATTEMIDSEGWLRTGDIGYASEDGQLFVVDRLKELIKYKGRQVAPAELEAILISHPAVADAGVVPSFDGEAGEIPKAFVVLKNEVSAAELMHFVAERVAPHKKIRSVEFINEIPRSPAGKILRRLLVARERASHDGSKPVPSGKMVSQL
jgi:acyl-CoA synthetase (AMP-forming)/AMP-acid ligase II